MPRIFSIFLTMFLFLTGEAYSYAAKACNDSALITADCSLRTSSIQKTLHATYAYGPFGEKIHATGPRANTNPWRWASKYLDEETGLYYFGKRYYDPITGQWLSREPLGESESLNLFTYCHNDPVNKVDVLGLEERVIVSAEPQVFTTGNKEGVYYIGWATEKDGLLHDFEPTGNNYYQGPFNEFNARSIMESKGRRRCLQRNGAILAFKSQQIQQKIEKLEVAIFYLENSAQAALGIAEATGSAMAAPTTGGVSFIGVFHGSDIIATAGTRMRYGPGVDIQSGTSLAFQAIGFDRPTAEFGDRTLSFAVPAQQLTNFVLKTPVPLSQVYANTIYIDPTANSVGSYRTTTGLADAVAGGPINPAGLTDNCVACVTAVLHNKGVGAVTRDYVIASGRLGITGRFGDVVGGQIRTPEAALKYISESTGLRSSKIVRGAFSDAAEAGHYVVISDSHIIYGRVLPNGNRFLYDPQINRILSWDDAVKVLHDSKSQVHLLSP